MYGCSTQPQLAEPNPMGLSGTYPKEAEAHFALARILWGDSDVCRSPEEAITHLDRAIRVAPDYAEAYLRRGMAKSDLRDWDGAFDDITRSIRLQPTAAAYAYRGLVSMRGGNALGARKDLDRSLELDSDQHRAWNFRGALSILLYDYPAACKDFKKGCSNGDCTGLNSATENGYCK